MTDKQTDSYIFAYSISTRLLKLSVINMIYTLYEGFLCIIPND